MFPFNDIFPMIILTLEIMLREPIFWLVVLLIGLQYRRINSLRESLYSVPLKSNWSEVSSAILFGLLGGLLGSLLMVFIGVTLNESGLIYIWPLAILLMLINARFICFAYAGGGIGSCTDNLRFSPVERSSSFGFGGRATYGGECADIF